MLHEIILSLLGFTGDIIIQLDGTFAVEPNFDLLADTEKEQVNRIVRIGWFYDFLSKYIRKNEMQWGGAPNGERFQAYRAALCLAVGDVLEEYVEDVSEIESKIFVDGPVPLSFISQHLQKYTISMPSMYSICMEIERRSLRGCQILDYLCGMQSGVPVVNAVVSRMILRTRVVFLKQTLGWMLHGTLHDPGMEFFIQAKQVESISGAADLIDGQVFDWAASYALRLDVLPESHVSARLAAKIMFVGKAVKLLRHFVHGCSGTTVGTQHQQFSDGEKEIMSYFGGNGGKDWVLETADNKPVETMDNISERIEVRGGNTASPNLSSDTNGFLSPVLDRHSAPAINGLFGDGKDIFNCDSYVLEVLQEQHKHWSVATARECDDPGKTGGEISDGLQLLQHCASVFEDILCKPDLAVDIFEQLVEEIHDRASVQLWAILKEHSSGPVRTALHKATNERPFRFGFFEYLHLLRNVFLLGKGEFYQALLDNLLGMIQDPLPLQADNAPQVDRLLKTKVLRKTARILNLEDDSLCDLFSLRAHHSGISITDFSSALEVGMDDSSRVGDVTLTGSAVVQSQHLGSKSGRSVVRLGGVLLAERGNMYDRIWQAHHMHPRHEADSVSLANKTRPSRQSLAAALECLKYQTGSAWLSDERYVGKGFAVSVNFTCGWNALMRCLVPGHPLMEYLAAKSKLHDPATDNEFAHDYDYDDDISVLSAGDGDALNRPGEVDIPIGCVSWVVYGGGALSRMNQRQQQQSCDKQMVYGMDAQGSVSVGVSFHVRRHRGIGECNLIAKVFISSTPVYSFTGGSMTVGGGLDTKSTIGGGSPSRLGGGRSLDGSVMMAREGVHVVCRDEIQLYTGSSESWRDSPCRDPKKRAISASSLLCLEVEYTREIVSASGGGITGGGGSSVVGASPSVMTGRGSSAGGVINKLRGRVREQGIRAAASDRWDVEVPITLESHMRLHGGRSFVGVTTSGCVISSPHSSTTNVSSLTSSPDATFYADVNAISFKSKGSPGSTTSSITATASSHVFARYPMVFSRLEECLSRYRLWLNLKMKVLNSPKQLSTIFDADAMKAYGSLFSLLLKIRIVVYAMERRCVSSSTPLNAAVGTGGSTGGQRRQRHNETHRRDRGGTRGSGGTRMSHLRHSMLFFLSNLLLYLQVDVIDAEYTSLVTQLKKTNSFRGAFQLHKTFLAAVARLAMVDNAVVQDGIDRVIQVCLRYLAISQVMDEMEEQQIVGSTLSAFPVEELEALRKDFYTQVSYLFQLMRKVENRGFIFRLDFNGFLSEVCDSFSPAAANWSHVSPTA